VGTGITWSFCFIFLLFIFVQVIPFIWTSLEAKVGSVRSPISWSMTYSVRAGNNKLKLYSLLNSSTLNIISCAVLLPVFVVNSAIFGCSAANPNSIVPKLKYRNGFSYASLNFNCFIPRYIETTANNIETTHGWHCSKIQLCQ
jgi:hypothetical protein